MQDDHDPQADHHDEPSQRMADPPGDEHGKNDATSEGPPRVMFVLVPHELRSTQVLHVVVVGAVAPEQDPADVRVPESPVDAVGVMVRIGEPVVLTVLRRPFQRGFLEGGRAE
jgi:hypothetical protein